MLLLLLLFACDVGIDEAVEESRTVVVAWVDVVCVELAVVVEESENNSLVRVVDVADAVEETRALGVCVVDVCVEPAVVDVVVDGFDVVCVETDVNVEVMNVDGALEVVTSVHTRASHLQGLLQPGDAVTTQLCSFNESV